MAWDLTSLARKMLATATLSVSAIQKVAEHQQTGNVLSLQIRSFFFFFFSHYFSRRKEAHSSASSCWCLGINASQGQEAILKLFIFKMKN